MSEIQKNPETNDKPTPLFDDCSSCDQRYQLTGDNSAGRLYPKQPECNYMLCVCPNCSSRTRIFVNEHTLEIAALNGIEVFDDEPYADDNAYSDWLDVKGIVLPETYQLTDRHEKLIGAFAVALASTPDEHLYDLIVDDGYGKPYPQKWI